VAVAGGGTAGHVTSALAIMAAYQAACDADVYFIGCQGGFETRLVPAAGFQLAIIPGAPYARQNLYGKLASLVALVRGTLAARRLLKARRTELVIGLGGYASLGPVLAARSLGIRLAIHEANVFPGLANRVIGSLSQRVFVGWEQTNSAFRRSKIVVTGNPVRPGIARIANQPRENSARGAVRRILVMGGSGGSPFLNDNVPGLLARVRDLGVPIAVRHQTGEGGTERLIRDYQQRNIQARVDEFIDNMAEAYCETDYVITTAGALTLAELAMFGLPAFLVPLAAAANDHQMANAETFAKHAGGAWVSESAWDGELLANQMAATLGDSEALSAQSRRLRDMAKPNAAHALVEECEALLAKP
jgi:UDP-N-acetylglucosamine--N-acetylmuramyl-(pentapeptide) pyrophosphoryl-undecaprenol N-acetylglucosamine transferase